ncbi:phosphate ABC transporter ATP-binding protein, partial [Mammaliicoccus vitulinus]
MTDVKIRDLSQNIPSNDMTSSKEIVVEDKNIVYKTNNLDLWYGDFHALR